MMFLRTDFGRNAARSKSAAAAAYLRSLNHLRAVVAVRPLADMGSGPGS
jgi:hypothetical protein